MNLVLDTGYYLLASEIGGRSASALLAFAKATARLRMTLHMSALVWIECVTHVCHAHPSLPHHAWEHSDAVAFLRRFPATVQINHPEAAVLIEAALNLRRVAKPGARAKARSAPTIVDAVSAELVRRLHAEVLVSDDRADFELLMPGFDGEIWAPRQLVELLRPAV